MPRNLQKDKRFRELEKQITPSKNYFYHRDKTLAEARDDSFDGLVLEMGLCFPTHGAMRLRQGWGTPGCGELRG